jgi:dTDP-4-amino-4,6-dideoxygalactose transaminase
MSATATAVVMAGGIPVFVDQDEKTGCLSTAAVAKAITSRTKAIIVVNLFGGPADVFGMKKLADQHGIILIEDNAQAPGGRKKGQMLGTIGHLGVYSLNCHKTIQCGEGGIVVTNNDDLARRVALVRNHGENAVQGMGCLQDSDIVGYNYRLTELQAAIARTQLDRLEELNDIRLQIVAGLDDLFSQFKGILFAKDKPGDRHVYYIYPLWITEKEAGISRNLFVHALKAEGAPIEGGYVEPLYRLPLFQNLIRSNKAKVVPSEGCPVAEKMFSTSFCYSTLVRVENGIELLGNMAAAVGKVMSHKEELRNWQESQGLP